MKLNNINIGIYHDKITFGRFQYPLEIFIKKKIIFSMLDMFDTEDKLKLLKFMCTFYYNVVKIEGLRQHNLHATIRHRNNKYSYRSYKSFHRLLIDLLNQAKFEIK